MLGVLKLVSQARELCREAGDTMILRAAIPWRTMTAVRAVIGASLAATFSSFSWVGVSAAPVVVTDYPGLVGTVGSNDQFNTGERFERYTVRGALWPTKGIGRHLADLLVRDVWNHVDVAGCSSLNTPVGTLLSSARFRGKMAMYQN